MWLGDQGAVNTLISLAQEGRDRIRREAIEALSGSRDDRVVAFLRDELNKTKNPYVRRRVVQAFAQMGGPDVVETLIKLIKDDSVRIRQSAVQALGQTGSPGAVEPLMERLQREITEEEDELEVQRSIVEALGRLGPDSKSVTFLLDKVLLAFELAYNIARIDPRASGLSLLGHDLAEIRQGAWKGVGSVGNVALITELHERLKNSDPSGLGKLGGDDKPFFRHAAYQAMDHILLRLEAEGVTSKQELERLKELASGASGTLCDHQGRPEAQGMCRRVE